MIAQLDQHRLEQRIAGCRKVVRGVVGRIGGLLHDLADHATIEYLLQQADRLIGKWRHFGRGQAVRKRDHVAAGRTRFRGRHRLVDIAVLAAGDDPDPGGIEGIHQLLPAFGDLRVNRGPRVGDWCAGGCVVLQPLMATEAQQYQCGDAVLVIHACLLR